ncbi:MAG: hypothetical protein M3417_16120 [Actinomycetota bacterium]|nr:hypothetical protein [Actinomycetota bacterium]
MSPEPAGGSPYLHHGDYWVAAAEAGEYPVRQGDLFANVQTADGAHLDAALIVHPTCELGKASVMNVQVTRVHPLDALPDENQRQRVVAGLSEKDGGLRIAFAHTFFVAPLEGSALDIPMWADLRELVLAPREQFTQDTRIGALTHDARVTFIRRYLYFRLRWSLSFEQVRDMEGARIAADPAFAGPRPAWVI